MSRRTVSFNGTEHWFFDGEFHRLDGPAITFADGTEFWYRNGKRHREGGPATTSALGSMHWFCDDLRHRLDGPAIVYADGEEHWYLHDEIVPDLNIVSTRIQRWYRMRKVRKFVRLLNTEGPFTHWFDSLDGWGGKWRKRDLQNFAGMIES